MASTSEHVGTNAVDPVDLADHGDTQAPSGTLDLAVNVLAGPPPWLAEELARVDLARYPRTSAAREGAASRHGVAGDRCLLTNGAAEAFWALAQGVRPRLAACVHPSFTAPEAALRAAGVPIQRVVRRPEDGFRLRPAEVPDEADLVVLGRPDNPTGRLEPADVVAELTRPGRVVVVDEAFGDFLDDAAGLAGAMLPGVVCVRSLTKLWGLAGLRVGYLLGQPATLASAAGALQPWPVNSLAARAVEVLSAPPVEVERADRAARVRRARDRFVTELKGLEGLQLWPSPANFVLLRGPLPDLRRHLLTHGVAARRCSTFPGLDDSFVRLAVPMDATSRHQTLEALAAIDTSPREGLRPPSHSGP